jgi:FkbM family methyltransferase
VHAVDYHFVEDGDSRTEMAAFIETSSAAPADALLLDVGSHIGLFSIVHLALAPGHRAVLFEPSPSLAATAQSWLAMNGMSGRGEARCAGVGSTAEMRMIETDALGFARSAAGPSAGTPVPFVTIDDVCESESLSPAIIKIDVEGHEAAVMAGARRTLRRHRPVICLELHVDMLEASGVPIDQVLSVLDASDYAIRGNDGRALSAAQIRRSLKAILRVIASPRARS